MASIPPALIEVPAYQLISITHHANVAETTEYRVVPMVIPLSAASQLCEAVAEQVKTQNGQSNRDSWRGGYMRSDQEERPARIEHVAP